MSQCGDIAHLPNDGSIVMAITKMADTSHKTVKEYLSVFDFPNSTHWKIEIPAVLLVIMHTLNVII